MTAWWRRRGWRAVRRSSRSRLTAANATGPPSCFCRYIKYNNKNNILFKNFGPQSASADVQAAMAERDLTAMIPILDEFPVVAVPHHAR